MIRDRVMCVITGKYVDGNKTVAYHLVGSNSDQEKVTKERLMYLIDNGQVANATYSTTANGEVLIRGINTNLTKLPVFDENRKEFRGPGVSNVSTRNSKVDGINQMGQLKITRRIVSKNACLGYEVMNNAGAVKRLQRKEVIELAARKLISNAVANKVTKADGTVEVQLRGKGIELKSLPNLIVTETGRVIDPNQDVSMTVRAIQVKASGVIKDLKNTKQITFRAGDVLVCKASGDITVLSGADVGTRLTSINDAPSALCDDYIQDNRYYIEIFGRQAQMLSKKAVTSWKILKYNAIEAKV